MRYFGNPSEREELPGELEIKYEKLKDKLERYGLWDDIEIDDEEYSESIVNVDIKYLGYHEDNTLGEVDLTINATDHFKIHRVRRRDIEAILEGETMVTEKGREEISARDRNYEKEAARD